MVYTCGWFAPGAVHLAPLRSGWNVVIEWCAPNGEPLLPVPGVCTVAPPAPAYITTWGSDSCGVRTRLDWCWGRDRLWQSMVDCETPLLHLLYPCWEGFVALWHIPCCQELDSTLLCCQELILFEFQLHQHCPIPGVWVAPALPCCPGLGFELH